MRPADCLHTGGGGGGAALHELVRGKEGEGKEGEGKGRWDSTRTVGASNVDH